VYNVAYDEPAATPQQGLEGRRDLSKVRSAGSLFLAFLLAAAPAAAQQPIAQSAAAQAAAAAPSKTPARRPMFLTGIALGIGGGVAIIAGTTFAKTSDSTSGNTPTGAFDNCVALKSNPVYSGNACEVLKGPNTALVIGGTVAAAAGVALAVMGAPHSSITFGPGRVGFRQRITF
jgi:hypothetical protein